MLGPDSEHAQVDKDSDFTARALRHAGGTHMVGRVDGKGSNTSKTESREPSVRSKNGY